MPIEQSEKIKELRNLLSRIEKLNEESQPIEGDLIQFLGLRKEYEINLQDLGTNEPSLRRLFRDSKIAQARERLASLRIQRQEVKDYLDFVGIKMDIGYLNGFLTRYQLSLSDIDSSVGEEVRLLSNGVADSIKWWLRSYLGYIVHQNILAFLPNTPPSGQHIGIFNNMMEIFKAMNRSRLMDYTEDEFFAVYPISQ